GGGESHDAELGAVGQLLSVLFDRVSEVARQVIVGSTQGCNDPGPLGARDDVEAQPWARHQAVARAMPWRCAGNDTSVGERSPTSPASAVYSSRMQVAEYSGLFAEVAAARGRTLTTNSSSWSHRGYRTSSTLLASKSCWKVTSKESSFRP